MFSEDGRRGGKPAIIANRYRRSFVSGGVGGVLETARVDLERQPSHLERFPVDLKTVSHRLKASRGRLSPKKPHFAVESPSPSVFGIHLSVSSRIWDRTLTLVTKLHLVTRPVLEAVLHSSTRDPACEAQLRPQLHYQVQLGNEMKWRDFESTRAPIGPPIV